MQERPNPNPNPNPNPGSKPFPSPKPDIPHSDPEKKSTESERRMQHAADKAAHKAIETEQSFEKENQEFSR
ncbi:MAG TPA: hypothetical protein VKR52_05830 [Terracidiphilus sp.]|nr:hypothetical protein [Terracidiphilus sp.]